MSLLAALPPAPIENEPLAGVRPSAETLAYLARRRSTKVVHLVGPGPAPEEIDVLIGLGARVPDHGKLGPWRFLVVEGAARAALGERLAAVFARETPGAEPGLLEAERARFLRAPACVIVISTAAPNPKIPEWEQVLSVGAVCHQLLLAAHAAGYGGCWLTGWAAYSAGAAGVLGLAAGEKIAGFLHLGTPDRDTTERPRPDARSRTERWTG